MAVVKSIVLTGPGATGNNSHTGFGFQPSGGIFASSFLTAVGDSTSVFASIALVDEAGNSICAGYEDNDAQATIDANKVFNTGDTICRLDSAGAQVDVADWVSWGADGVTLNWKETSAWKVGCLAFNSANVETEVGTFNLNTSTGNQTVTMSASWTPTAVIFLHAIENTTLGASAHGRIGMGVMTGANQWAWCATDQDAGADSVAKRSFNTSKCFTSHATASAHAVTFEAEFVSMAAGQFTFNLTTAPGAAVTVGYMAIRGIDAAAVFPDAKETTGTEAYTGWGMTPLAVLAAGPQFATTDGTIAGTNIASFGASDGTTNWCASTHIEDAATSSNTARDWTETYFWLEISSTGADVVAASTSSFGTDGATLNFATTTAGTRYKPIIAFGTTPISFDAFTSTEGVYGQTTPLSFNHTPVGTPKGVLVQTVIDTGVSTLTVTGVTYGGVAMSQVAGSPLDTSGGEPGHVTTWFLGSGISSGVQSVAFTFGGDGSTDDNMLVSCTTVTTADGSNTSVVDTDFSIDLTSAANPSGTLSLGGIPCFCSVAFFSGQNDVADIAPTSNWTARREFDMGTATAGIYTYNTVSTPDVAAGWTQTAEDATAISVAIRAGAPASAAVFSVTGPTSIAEGSSGTYTVSYTNAVLAGGETATIVVASADLAGGDTNATSGTDYTALSTTLTFTGGAATTKTVALSTIQDTIVEGTEDFRVTISGQSTGTIATSQANGAIADDDSTNLNWSITGSSSITEGGTAGYTVSYTGATLASGVTATITVASADLTGGDNNATSGTDYTALSSVLTFTGGGVTTKTVAVSSIQDTSFEGTEDFRVTLGGASSGTLVASQVNTIIVDDELAAGGDWYIRARRRGRR